LKFFEFLQGNKKFDYGEYTQAFNDFSEFINNQELSPPDFMKHSDDFIQFLYDQNIISFIEPTEDENFIRWCFRERSITNISPKVKLGMKYEIHYGLANTLNTGKKFVKPSIIGSRKTISGPKKSMNEGRIVRIFVDKKFGFIKQEGLPIDIYFSTSDLDRKYNFEVGQKVCFLLERSEKREGGLVAKDISKI
jgi:cold shock CspA family protein